MIAQVLLAALTSFPFDVDFGRAPIRPDPTGCPAFEIAAPQKTGGAVVKAEDFGFSTTNDDNGAAIGRALAECRRTNAAKLVLKPGVYRCFGPKGILIDGFADFIFDGAGAELVFRRAPRLPIEPSWDHDGSDANFVIRNCRRMNFGNLVTDWDWRTMPLATGARVVATHVDAKADNASYVDFELLGHGARHPYFGKAFPIQRTQPMTSDLTRFLPGLNLWHGTYEGETGCKVEWLSPTCIRAYPFVETPDLVRWRGPNMRTFSPKLNRDNVLRHKVGETYRLAHAYYGKGGFTLISNEDLDLHDIEIPSCFGHAVYIGGTQQRWRLRNVTVAPRDYRHPISSTADAVHFVRSCGKTEIDNLTVKLEQDDAINVHDRFTAAKPVGECTLEVILERGARYFLPAVGDQVELRDPGYNAVGWFGKVAKLEGERIAVDRPLPAALPEEGWFLVFDRTASSDGIVIRNCTFEDMEMRTLVNVSDATVENCRFVRTNGDALRCIADYTLKWWCEGMGTTNVVVRNCTFENNCVRELVGSYYSLGADFSTWLGRPDQVKEARLDRTFISDILVEGCMFRDSLGYFADLRSGANLTFRGNVIERTGRRAECRETSGSARIERLNGVRFENNIFKVPDGAPAPRLDVAEGREGVVLKGNRVCTSIVAKIAARHRILGEDVWYGYRRVKFDFSGRTAWVVEPNAVPQEGRPWTWTMQWAEAYVDRTGVLDLLKNGHHHVTINLYPTRMDETGLAAAAEYQRYLVDELGFAPKAKLVGMSWGGFFSTRYAAAYPANVEKVYLDAPLLTFNRFGGEQTEARIGSWAKLGVTDWSADKRMPVNLAEPIAKAGIPILLLYGGQDQTVNPVLNCELFVERFKAAGGRIEVVNRPYFGHHPHGLDPDKTDRIVRFFR